MSNLFHLLQEIEELELSDCDHCQADTVQLYKFNGENLCQECLEGISYEDYEALTPEERNR